MKVPFYQATIIIYYYVEQVGERGDGRGLKGTTKAHVKVRTHPKHAIPNNSMLPPLFLPM